MKGQTTDWEGFVKHVTDKYIKVFIEYKYIEVYLSKYT